MESTRLIQSTCAYCGVGCGVDISRPVTVADTTITNSNQVGLQLSGSQCHPANFGRLCVKGTNLLTTTSLEGRLLYPEISGTRATWSDATNHVADRFSEIIMRYGADAIAFYVSGQLLTEDYYVANKLMKGYIGSANIDTNSRLCMSSAVTAYKRAFGEDVVPGCYEDIELTDLLILAGSNAAWTHPVLFQRIERAKAINPEMKIIALDPRRTATTQLADIHLALRPGSDAAFFCGLLRYMKENAAVDQEYIASHTQGAASTFAAAEPWTIDQVADFCQVESEVIEQVYQWYCQLPRAVTMYSMGINQSASGVDKCQAIINCHLAAGKIGKAGCGPFSITGQPNAMGGREVGGLATQLAAHMDIEQPLHRQAVQEFWQSPSIPQRAGYKATEIFDAVLSGKIKAIWIMGTNPLVSLPDKNKVEQALVSCELVVVSDCVEKNDTLRFADVKLPAAPWLEKDGTVTNSERCISRQRQVVEAAGEALPDWQIIGNVAKAMGFNGFDFQSPYQIFMEHVALTALNNQGALKLDLSGLTGLSERSYDQFKPKQWPITNNHPDGQKRIYSDGVFSTTNKRANLLPVLPELPQLNEEVEYSFLLNSGRTRDQWHTMTRTGKAAVLTEHCPFPQLEIHPTDATRLQLSNNDLVNIHNNIGQACVAVKLSDSQHVSEVFLPIHWSDTFASSAAVNRLYQCITDPLSGQAQTKQTSVALSKMKFALYGQIFSRNICKPETEFWQQAVTSYGYMTEVASAVHIEDLIKWSKQLLGESGEWSYRKIEHTHFMCRWQNLQLDGVVIFTDKRIDVNWAWYDYVFKQQQLELPILSALLCGDVDSQYAQGKMVCSCFGVGEKAIKKAIKGGANTVEDLGNTLKCGSNCGSCKPELRELIHLSSDI